MHVIDKFTVGNVSYRELCYKKASYEHIYIKKSMCCQQIYYRESKLSTNLP